MNYKGEEVTEIVEEVTEVVNQAPPSNPYYTPTNSYYYYQYAVYAGFVIYDSNNQFNVQSACS